MKKTLFVGSVALVWLLFSMVLVSGARAAYPEKPFEIIGAIEGEKLKVLRKECPRRFPGPSIGTSMTKISTSSMFWVCAVISVTPHALAGTLKLFKSGRAPMMTRDQRAAALSNAARWAAVGVVPGT